MSINPNMWATEQTPDPWLTAMMADDRAEILRIANTKMLIKGVLPIGALSFLFGESGSGKSFVMIDAACSISTGEPWLGLETPTEGGLVVYIAAEGANGLRVRKFAWEQDRGLQAGNMRILPEAVMMDNPKQVERLILCIKKLCLLSDNSPPVLIVLDTFARSMLGEENSNTDAAAFVRGCEALRVAFDCAVVAVHHSGHKDKSRMRGASALHAAADSVIKLDSKPNNIIQLSCAKSKDIEEFIPLKCKLEKTILKDLNAGTAAPVSTLTVQSLSSTDNDGNGTKFGKNDNLLMEIFQHSPTITKQEAQELFLSSSQNSNKNRDSATRLFRKAFNKLQEKNHLTEVTKGRFSLSSTENCESQMLRNVDTECRTR
jgi:hypothetical protein